MLLFYQRQYPHLNWRILLRYYGTFYFSLVIVTTSSLSYITTLLSYMWLFFLFNDSNLHSILFDDIMFSYNLTPFSGAIVLVVANVF